MKSPVLLVAWRRPELTRRVIASIRTYAPDQMYVACDGPNPQRQGEQDKVNETRRVIDSEINWPCKIYRRYSETNQGCRLGVSSAISWFFENVEEGIIIEDDCLPNIGFYNFCENLLNRYRDNDKVCCISGNNFQGGAWRSDGSYYFSRYNHCWGWASWRKAWDAYDAELEGWKSIRQTKKIREIFSNPIEAEYWSKLCDSMLFQGIPDTWDIRWFIGCALHSRLTAIPNRNMVVNIGFGEDATHCTTYRISMFAEHADGPIEHPTFVLRHPYADEVTFNNLCLPTHTRNYGYCTRKIRNALNKLRGFARPAGLR
jgi:hypothetical protein